ENYGTEQEHLNNVFGARLRITSLQAAAGPGIEFLEYVAPRDGRPRPPDARPNDVLHWQTRLVTPNAEKATQYVRKGPSSFISPGVVATTDGRIGFKKAILVQDPDGHAIQLVEE
ncbi:MAG: VOC family protein, partial [Nitrospiraceae bacterium]